MLSRNAIFFFATSCIASVAFILGAGCGSGGSDATTSEGGGGESNCDGACVLHLDSGIRDGAWLDVKAGPHYPDGSAPAASTDVKVLPFDVVDARQSAALDAIVLISKTPASVLRILHPSDGTTDEIALSSVPTSLALDPSGKLAVVGHHALISYVDLVSKTVTTTCTVGFDVATIAVDETPMAYAVPAVEQWVSVHQIDLGTCVDRTVKLTNFVRAASPLAMHPSGQAFFVADADLANDLTRCVVGADAGLACKPFTPDTSPGYQYCGRLWLSPDGSRL